LFLFCYSKEGDDGFATIAFFFSFVATKKVTAVELLSPSILVLL
jgi:hypothetical protein